MVIQFTATLRIQTLILCPLLWIGLAQAQLPPNVEILHEFNGGATGTRPDSSVIQTPDGSLVGVSFPLNAESANPGYLYEISPAGEFATLREFPADGSQGGVAFSSRPSSIMQAGDEAFYGTFPTGGPNGGGTVYRVSPTGDYRLLYAFEQDAFSPTGPLVEAYDGNLYGVVRQGPGNYHGAIFRVGLDGSFSYVYYFTDSPPNGPTSALAMDSQGILYGTLCGKSLCGLYKFDPAANMVTLLATVSNFVELGDGFPVIGPDSRAYFGEAESIWCNCPYGAIDSIGLGGSPLAIDYSYTNTYAANGLTLGADGKFYSVNASGSRSNGFQVDLASQTQAVSSLSGVGTIAAGNLTQISNGSFAGATEKGGSGGASAGTVFLWDAAAPKPAPAILGFQPSIARVGQSVTIWGKDFVGTTGVSINGTPASFKTAASGFVSLLVPQEATSGTISISNQGGTTTSINVLTVEAE